MCAPVVNVPLINGAVAGVLIVNTVSPAKLTLPVIPVDATAPKFKVLAPFNVTLPVKPFAVTAS